MTHLKLYVRLYGHIYFTERLASYFRDYSCSKEDQLQILQMVHLKTTAIYFQKSSNRLVAGFIIKAHLSTVRELN